ncbi:MAG: hypothetical protein P8175_00035 [Deltaproteobacteria bacterium]|jgi:hypothetical protein
MDGLEYMTAQDVFFDFCLWEYTPLAPWENKFSSSTLLFHSFKVAGLDERIFDLIQAIRKGIGLSRTVWGVKQLGDDIRWEFYFYDYRRRERERSITKVLEIMRPFVRCGMKVNENYHYFMFSIDISGDLFAKATELEEIHMYIGNVGSTVSSGICYSLKNEGTRLENFYFFFDAKTQGDEILGKVVSSAYIDTTVIKIDQILWPEMRDCKVIVVANKQSNDAVYFSRINVDQLIFFLNRMNYPNELISFIEKNRAKLDHLQYDVGYDYKMDGKDLMILKSGYYGIF